jgi:hypothetical protein
MGEQSNRDRLEPISDLLGICGTRWSSLVITPELTAGELREQLKTLPEDTPIHIFCYLSEAYTTHDGKTVDAFRIPVKVSGEAFQREHDIIRTAEVESGR